MSNLIDLQFQIEKLQKQANEIKAKEFANTVQDILAKMQAFGITVKDLQSAKPARGGNGGRGKFAAGKAAKAVKSAKGPKKSAQPVAAKYRGPNGETWSGRGLTPKWLAALVAQGQSKDAFLIA
ncbi:H-NS family nucleoid-associated regulatory protein [Rhodoferax saidenbachensis]|uniref:Nucleoid-structuring protein H-NS n=1 Tax=Rhodoferax saidenbachensis TaxID=1484693 RepID=A0A1P8KDW9_9BURK|nr:H-NS histone family protein [Rhodoferax saidenbachensis]APW44162.1 nucleoid-structuring protein H-NS [Rhodoferax saidenbachensis]